MNSIILKFFLREPGKIAFKNRFISRRWFPIRFCEKFSNKLINGNRSKWASKSSRASKFIAFGLLSGFRAAPVVVIANQQRTTVAAASRKALPEEVLQLDESVAAFPWWQLWRLIHDDVYPLIAAVACALAVALLNVQLPLHLGQVINVIARYGTSHGATFTEDMKRPVFKVLSLYTAQALFTFLYVYLLSSIGERLAANMKYNLFVAIMRQDTGFFDEHRTGELTDRLTTDVQEFKSAFKMCISQGLRSIAQIGGCLASLIVISPEMTGAVAFILPSIVWIGTSLGSSLRKLSKKAQQQSAEAAIVGEEAISNIRTVRSFAMEEYECELFRSEIEEASTLNRKLGFGIALFQAGTNIFLNSLVLGTLCMGGYMLSLNKLTSGDLMSFLVAVQTIQRSMAQLSLLFASFVKGLASGSRVFQLISTEKKIDFSYEKGDIIPYHSLIADVAFENVRFSYPTRPGQVVLKGFDLFIPAGKVAAIVGSSGNGKSTVAALLMRLYDVSNGSISVGGRDIKDLNENWLRGKLIGLINQEPTLFATSVKENIRYGNPEATDAEVVAAAKLANCDEFVESFPEGYDTLVGEKGVAVSGGQKQRIAIARALLKKPAILILDEATSALDSKSERQVQESLEKAMKGRTVLVIAHRLSTIQNADIIVVLNDGMVVEMGNHDDLMKKRSFYWNLMNQQKRSVEQ